MNFSSSRLKLICNHLSGFAQQAPALSSDSFEQQVPVLSSASSKQKPPVLSSIDFCFFDDLLKPEEIKFRKEVREFAETEITPFICNYYEKAEFPQSLFEKLGEKNWLSS